MKQEHPMQPIYIDKNRVARFKENKIVRYMLDRNIINMNDIALLVFPEEDKMQFAQLVGYSVDGYGDLSYVSDESYNAAFTIANKLFKKIKLEIIKKAEVAPIKP